MLLHDSTGRENEVDMIAAADFVTPDQIATMRQEAGGLLCLAIGHDAARTLGIPRMREIQLFASERFPILKSLDEENAPYGGKSPFSITLSHRRTFTGITDRDRALTTKRMAELCSSSLNCVKGLQDIFAAEFKSPGHVHLLVESEASLAERRGHTELSVYLCRRAGLTPAAVICEMLDSESHEALSVAEANEYARENSLPILEGEFIVRDFTEHNYPLAELGS